MNCRDTVDGFFAFGIVKEGDNVRHKDDALTDRNRQKQKYILDCGVWIYIFKKNTELSMTIQNYMASAGKVQGAQEKTAKSKEGRQGQII